MHKDIILYGGQLPEPCYVLRMPAKGVPWRKLMQAAQRLVKKLTGTPAHKAAPYWNIDGDAPDWETTKQLRYIFDQATGEFVAVERARKKHPKPPKRCHRKRCAAVWTCRDCGRKCCEHHCSHKKPDGSATCGACAAVAFARKEPEGTDEEEALAFLYDDEAKLEGES